MYLKQYFEAGHFGIIVFAVTFEVM